MTRDDIIAKLEISPLFGVLPRAACEALASQTHPQGFDPGGVGRLFTQGETSRSLWLPVDGAGTGPAVQIAFGEGRRGGGRLALRMIPGELVGDIDLLLVGLGPRLAPHLGTAEAMRPILALELSVAALSQLAAEHEPLRRRLIRDAAQRLRHLVGAATSESRWPEVNFARRLLDFFEDFGSFQGNAVHLRERMTQQAIATGMGVSLRLLAQYLTKWSRLGLVGTLPVAILDFQRLDRIAGFGDMPAAEVLVEAIGRLDQMFRHAAPLRAAEEAGDLLRIFPGNPGLLHLLALTALHNHNPVEAARLVAPLFTGEGAADDTAIGPVRLQERIAAAWIESVAPQNTDEEVEAGLAFDQIAGPLCRDLMGLQARLAKDQACQESGAGRRPALARAARLYANIHLHRPDAYPALNAAGLFYLAGRPEPVVQLARAAHRLATGDSYWDIATRGEASLLLGETAVGLAEITAAARIAGPAERASTRRQLRQLEGSGLAAISEAMALLDPGPVVAFSGAMLDLPGRDPPAPGMGEAMRTALHNALAESPPAWLLLGLASGADILAAEEAMRLKIPCEVVLPFPSEKYVAASVAPSWSDRFYRCLERAARVTVLWRGAAAPARIERHFERANRHMLGLSRLVAHRLDSGARLVTLTDNGSGSIAGTAVMRRAALAAGLSASDLIFPGQRPDRVPVPPPPPLFAPVVRVLALVANTRLEDQLRAAGLVPRRLKSQALAAEHVAADLAGALALADALTDLCESTSMTVLCDFAPVLRLNGQPDREVLSQLLPVPAMGGAAILSAEFVTEALCDGAQPATFVELLTDGRGEVVTSGTRRFFRNVGGAAPA